MRDDSLSSGKKPLPDARLGIALAALLPLGAVEDDCTRLGRAPIRDVTIERASLEGDVCRVTGIARPVPRSAIRFDVRLPPPARWSGRYYQIGNGGFAGAISASALAEGAARGDAIAASDTGHIADAFDASWATGNPERVIDYGYRAIKGSSDAAGALTQAYYGRPAAHRYFMGCSNGGRMALMAASRYPTDWDGVIAGAPATPWTTQFKTFGAVQRRLRDTTDSWLPRSALVAIRAAALASCPKPTIVDGVPERPLECRFDPTVLTCRAGAGKTCLTRPQLASLRAIMAAGYDPASADPDDWVRWIANPDPSAPSQATFAREAAAYLPDGPAMRATLDVDPASLRAFRRRGGKILSYFGWADAVIAPRLGLAFYRAVVRDNRGHSATARFYRLFMVPGMLHCQGGPGATAFGQSLPAPSMVDDAEHDVRRALERWVEQGQAPTHLIAARYAGDDRTRGVTATRGLQPVR